MSILFEPVKVGPITFRNRFVRSATQDWMAEKDGKVSARQLQLYEDLAAGGVGLILTAHSYVSYPQGKAANLQNGIYNESFSEGYKKMVDVVHRHDAKIFLQLAHAGYRTSPELIAGQMPVAPSDMYDEKGQQVARSLTKAEIKRLVEDYESAAVRAKKAGFDGVQIHMAHGYLLAQFLSPFFNQRCDDYGGTVEQRGRLLAEISAQVRAAVGQKFPVFVKLNTTDGVSDEAHLSFHDVIYTAKMLVKNGIDAIETSGGAGEETRKVMAKAGILKPEQEAYFAQAAQNIRNDVKVPVLLVGGLRSAAVMEEVLATGTADMVSLSRPFIREPDLVKKLAAGQTKATCISCNGCFVLDGIKCTYKE